MRWFCVHPALPDNATLRVRSYPSSDAPELGGCRVPKGRAVAVVAPEFEVDTGSDANVYRWVSVVVPEADSSEECDGFMMASLPDGTELLTSWHKAGFRSCCRVVNPKAFLFDGPTTTADVVGLVDSTGLPYGVLEVEGPRALILHAELGRVWIDTKELDPVSLPLHHSDCSVAHSFFTLNEALPPEAQIAIRTFPSKEAETVGLLSRGDILEVSFKSGVWLQIATPDEGDAFWIMWTTEAVDLLVEVPHHESPRCMLLSGEPISHTASTVEAESDDDEDTRRLQLAEESGDIETETFLDARDAEHNEGLNAGLSKDNATGTTKALPPQLGEDPVIYEGSASPHSLPSKDSEAAAPEIADRAVMETPTDEMASAATSIPSKLTASWEDRPIKPARQEQFTWDDRPIEPPRTNGSDDEHTSSIDYSAAAAQGNTSDQPSDSTGSSAHVDTRDDSEISFVSASCNGLPSGDSPGTIEDPDERPIKPATSASLQVGGTSRATAPLDPDNRPIKPVAVNTDMSTIETCEHGDGAKEEDTRLKCEPQSGPHPDDRPIRPAQQHQAWDECLIQPMQPANDMDAVESCTVTAGEVSTPPIELPLQPAQAEEDADMHSPASAKIDSYITANAIAESESLHPDERPIKPAQRRHAWDERPIRSTGADEESLDGGASEVFSKEAYAHPDERPIRPARQRNVWDDDPIQPAVAQNVLETDILTTDEHDTDMSDRTAEASANESSPSQDVRPLQSAQQSFAWDDRPIRQTRVADGENENKGVLDASDAHAPNAVAFDQDGQSSDAAQAEANIDADMDENDGVEKMETEDAAGIAKGATSSDIDQQAFHADDRPIRPAQTRLAWDDRSIKSTRQDHTWDEVPILPASEDVEMDIYSADEIEATDLLPHDAAQKDDSHAASRHWDHHPITSKQQRQGLDKLPIQPEESHEAFTGEQTAFRSSSHELDAGATHATNSVDPRVESDGYAFLTQFGVAAYYNWKRRSMATLDELTQIQYDAMVEGDVDVLLEALAADVDLIDEWLQHVPIDPASVANAHSNLSHATDALYGRDSVASDQTRSAQNGHAEKPLVLPLSPTSARKAKIKALFHRLPRNDTSAGVFDVIMGGGNGDNIIEAEVANDDSDFTLTSEFMYPTRSRRGRGGTPGRPLLRHERGPAPIGAGATALRRVVSAGSVGLPPTTSNETNPPKRAANDAGITRPAPRVVSIPDTTATPLQSSSPIAAAEDSINAIENTEGSAPDPVPPAAHISLEDQETIDEVKTSAVPAQATVGIPAPRSSIALPPSNGVSKVPVSSMPAPSLARPRPLASRLSAPSSISSIAQRSGSLPQPSSVPRSALPVRSISTATTSAALASAAGGHQSLMPRRSLLPIPSKPSGLQAPATRSISQATNTSTLEARRATFGFSRPRPSTTSKPTK